MKITATNKITGEVIELPADSLAEIVEAWRFAQEYEKAAALLKDQLKKIVPALVGANGLSEQFGSYQFRVSSVQLMNYDKAAMREVLDPDTFDTLVKPDKPAVDRYLRENLESLGDDSTHIRQAMVPQGEPFQVIRLERITRKEDA